MLFYFHGYSGDYVDSDTRRDFENLYPEATVVYAEGLPYQPPAAPLLGWQQRFPYVNTVCGETSDVAYILDILATLVDVDPSRIYASGHSSGAFFTLSLMELMPDTFTGYAMLGGYSRFEVDVTTVDCVNNLYGQWPLPLDPVVDVAATPRPVLYMFGDTDTTFDGDGPDVTPGWTSVCSANTRAHDTLQELTIRNQAPLPDCTTSAYLTDQQRWVFSPPGPGGAEVHWQLYSGGHGWEEYLPSADQEVVDFLRGL